MGSRGYNKEIVATFAKCFRLIAGLGVVVDDAFFVSLLNKESEKLLDNYIKFLKCEGIPDVAQCCYNLILQIKNILGLLNIINHINIYEPIPCLILQKNLLYLELLILNLKKESAQISYKKEVAGRISPKIADKVLSKKIGAVHNDIINFLSGKDRVQNTEVFIKFSYIAKRTLKRKLSELISAGSIKRLTLGKKVFYHSVDPAPEKHLES